MKQEIERKFLVDHAKLPTDLKWESVRQGYLAFEPQVRIRVWQNKNAITIKSAGTLVRNEWEFSIPEDEAESLLKLCGDHKIEKERSLVWIADKEWCVDRFHGKHEGLITAEIELESENEQFESPTWVTKEVTGDERYLNINLVRT